MFEEFKETFAKSQAQAHNTVITGVTELPIEVWPPLDPLPELPHNATPAQQHEFDEKLQRWSDSNLLTLSKLRHQTLIKFDDLHYSTTLDLIYLEQAHSAYGNDSMAFEHLTRSFLLRISLPHYCGESFPRLMKKV